MKVELYGTSFVLETDESNERLEHIIQYLKDKEQQVIALSPHLTDPLKKSILSSFLAANELLKLKEQQTTESKKIRDETLLLTEKMIRQLDQSMHSSID